MKSIRHSGIVVSNLKRSLYFYRNLLGFRIIKKAKEDGRYIDTLLGGKGIVVTTVKMACDDGNLIELLYFHAPNKDKKKERRAFDFGISHLALTVSNLDKEYHRLSGKGIEFISEPQLSPDGKVKVVFCKDYDNVLIELVEPLQVKFKSNPSYKE